MDVDDFLARAAILGAGRVLAWPAVAYPLLVIMLVSNFVWWGILGRALVMAPIRRLALLVASYVVWAVLSAFLLVMILFSAAAERS